MTTNNTQLIQKNKSSIHYQKVIVFSIVIILEVFIFSNLPFSGKAPQLNISTCKKYSKHAFNQQKEIFWSKSGS